LAVFQILAWLVYLRSVYSASASPGDLRFLRSELNSTRFIEGPLFVGGLWLVWVLQRRGLSKVLLYAFLAAQVISCVAVLQRRAPEGAWQVALLGGIVLAVISWSWTGRAAVSAFVLSMTVMLPAGMALVEHRRSNWLPELQPLYRLLYDAAPATMYYVIDDEYGPQWCWEWPMWGRRLQHRIETGTREQLTQLTSLPTYVAWTAEGANSAPPKLAGYSSVILTEKGALLRRDK